MEWQSGRSGIAMGSQCDHIWVAVGSQWDHSGIAVVSQWDQSGITDHNGITVVGTQWWYHNGIALATVEEESPWDRSGGAPGGSLWDHCGITVVSLLWDRCGGITVVSLSYHGGTTVCGTTNCCGITMGSSQWDHSRIIVRWYHCGIIVCVGSLWDQCGVTVGSLRDHHQRVRLSRHGPT